MTAKWTKQRKSEERHASAQRHRMDRLFRPHVVTVKEAAFSVNGPGLRQSERQR
jgi:hypothetical protein